jgi:cation diffusion facilitator CzcD-associated flavoprotein CzcO
MSDAATLSASEALRLLGPFPENWVPSRPGIDHDVLVVGGGHTGSSFAFALQRAGIRRFSVIDAAPDEASSGVWLTRARMNLLRTPKSLPGPELGVQGLSFQAWYEAGHGRQAYADLVRIRRIDWASYLSWYRTVLGLDIRYATRLLRIEPAGDHFRLHLEIAGKTSVETARKVILGNGVAGSGYPYVPENLITGLSPALYAHTAEAIDFQALRGKSVAVIGAAASAFDAAGTALEAGAAEVHLFARRDHVASLPVSRVRGYPGAYDNYAHLPDEIRWQQAFRFRQAGSTPPPDAIERAVRFANFHLHLASPWRNVGEEDGRVVASLDKGEFRFDFAIAGTGYRTDLSQRPELRDVAGNVLLWRDRYTPSAEEEDADLGAHPYLGLAHELQEKWPGEAPHLNDIHIYNPGGFVSFGLPIGDVPSLRRDVAAVVSGISRDLFLRDLEHHKQRITADIAPDFTADAYRAALWSEAQRQAAE